MNVIRWNPFRELEDMQLRLDRMLGEVDRRKGQSDEPFAFADWAPAVDIQETDAEFVVKADLPDMKKEDITIKLVDAS
jgi:HSP20 family protein